MLTLDVVDTLDEFTKAYIVAMLWAETDGDKPLDDDHGIYDLAPEALARCIADCKQFQRNNAADLAQFDSKEWTPEELGGHDLLLTRNHHGCGYWDRNCLPKPARNRLTDAAHRLGEVYPYVGDDGLIYLL